MSKKNWFKNKREFKTVDDCATRGNARGESTLRESVPFDENEPETVIFVPSTPRGELVKRLRESDIQFRKGSNIRQIKFVERAGVSIRDSLVSSNPWGEMKCGRKTCFVCKSEKGGLQNA